MRILGLLFVIMRAVDFGFETYLMTFGDDDDDNDATEVDAEFILRKSDDDDDDDVNDCDGEKLFGELVFIRLN